MPFKSHRNLAWIRRWNLRQSRFRLSHFHEVILQRFKPSSVINSYFLCVALPLGQIDKSVSRCTWYRQLRYSSSFRIFFTFYKCPVILVKPGKRKTARTEFPLVLICKSTWIRPDYQKSPRDWSSRNSGVTLFYLMKLPKMSSVSSVKGRPLWLLVLNMMWIYMWQAEWWLL